MKKKIVLLSLFLFIGICLAEIVLTLNCGIRVPRGSFEQKQFRYQYLDIYRPFFKKTGKSGEYVPDRFGNNAVVFNVDKQPGTVRIFIVGGSVAWNFGFYNLAETMKKLAPEKDFEVICCGMGAYDAYRDQLVLKEVLNYNPDMVIVFSGNNEFYDQEEIIPWAYYANNFFSRSWVYSGLQGVLAKCLSSAGWRRARDEKYVLGRFEKYLRLMSRMAKRKKVALVFCTLPVNAKDCPPYGVAPVDKLYILARLLLEKGDYPQAVSAFHAFLKEKDNDPFGLYFLGRAYEEMRDYKEAKECYAKAIDADWSSGGRATRKINGVIRKICLHEGIGLADSEAAFINLAPRGILGREQFIDNCHWVGGYNPVVAGAIITEIAKKKILTLKAAGDLFAPTPGVTSLKERGQNKETVRSFTRAAVWQTLQQGNGLCERTASYFETIYLMDRDELWKIKEEKDKLKRSFEEEFWTEHLIAQIEMHWPDVLYHVGEAYRGLGLYDEASVYFQKAISADKDFYLAYIGYASVQYLKGNKAAALESIAAAEKVSGAQEIKDYKDIIISIQDHRNSRGREIGKNDA